MCHLIRGRGQHAQHCRTTLAAPARIIWGPRGAEETDHPCVVSRETVVDLAISPIPRSRQACLLPHIKPETGRRPLPTTNRTADTGHVTACKTPQCVPHAPPPSIPSPLHLSRLTSHDPRPTTHDPPLTAHNPPLTAHRSPLQDYTSLLIDHTPNSLDGNEIPETVHQRQQARRFT